MQRHSVFCILPPHILINIAKNGTAAQREGALAALDLDHSHRSSRAAFSLMGGLKVPAVQDREMDASALPAKHRTIYDCGGGTNTPGDIVRSEGQAEVANQSVNRAYDGLGNTFDFYLSTYGRNSIDNKGLPLIASVHYGTKYDNALWIGRQMIFGDGDGVVFNDFTKGLDVIAHELTHGVTGSEANLLYQGQSGALNESISDVFGSLVRQHSMNQTADKADWLIGAGLLGPKIKGVAIRSMKAPGTAYDDKLLGKDPQPADMAHYVNGPADNGGVHTNSGIPNRAFYLVATNLGGFAWLKAGQIWYDALLDRNLQQTASFSAFANLTIGKAGDRYGSAGVEKKAVTDAWAQVGVPVAPA